jgi:hypothetical protein
VFFWSSAAPLCRPCPLAALCLSTMPLVDDASTSAAARANAESATRVPHARRTAALPIPYEELSLDISRTTACYLHIGSNTSLNPASSCSHAAAPRRSSTAFRIAPVATQKQVPQLEYGLTSEFLAYPCTEQHRTWNTTGSTVAGDTGRVRERAVTTIAGTKVIKILFLKG